MVWISAQTRVAMSVIQLSLLAVAQNFIRLGARFEFRFRRGVAGIAVGVILHRLTAIGALDVFGGSIFCDSQ